MSSYISYDDAQPRATTYVYQRNSEPVTHTHYSSHLPRSLGYSHEVLPSARVSTASRESYGAQSRSYVASEHPFLLSGYYERSFQHSPQRVIVHTRGPVVSTARQSSATQSYRPFLGMGMRTNARNNTTGLQCDVVWEQGPAQKAGIRLEDEIIAIGNSGQRLTSLKQAQAIIQDEARVGGYIRVIGRHADTGYRYETHVKVMTRDEHAGEHRFNTEGKKQLTLEKPLSSKNAIFNPNASRTTDALNESVVHPNTSARASEAALGKSQSQRCLEW